MFTTNIVSLGLSLTLLLMWANHCNSARKATQAKKNKRCHACWSHTNCTTMWTGIESDKGTWEKKVYSCPCVLFLLKACLVCNNKYKWDNVVKKSIYLQSCRSGFWMKGYRMPVWSVCLFVWKENVNDEINYYLLAPSSSCFLAFEFVLISFPFAIILLINNPW